MNRFERTLLGILVPTAVVSCIRAPYPEQMYLQHIPTAVAIIALPFVMRRKVWSTTAFCCVIAFLFLHVVGARYIYSYVPYDEWVEKLTGVNLSARFAFRRNHFDRIVHFAFGLLSIRPVWDVLTARYRVPPRFARYATVEFVLAFSLLYELFEWGLTMVLSPADAGAYNGEQGDRWDAHRDMAFALAGAIVGHVVWRLTETTRGLRRAGTTGGAE